MKNNNNNDKKSKKKILILIRRLILALVGLILGTVLYFANAQGIVGNQLPMPFGYGIANVLSGSMEPTFSKGTLLLVKETQDVETGDIVVYQAENSLIVHRIISINESEITTQGDANNTPDPVFQKTQIKGVVIGWIPYLGSISALLKTPAGIIILLLLAFLLIEGSFRKDREEDELEQEAIKEEIRKLREELEKKE